MPKPPVTGQIARKANVLLSEHPELMTMLSSAEHCRAKAFECADLAARTMDPFSKLLLEQTAERWYVLAVSTEKYEFAAIEPPQMDGAMGIA